MDFLGIDYNTAIVLVGTLLLGTAAGVVGSIGMLRGRALLGDALSHATLPGICLAYMLFGRSFPVLLGGALVTGLAGIIVVALLGRYTRIKQDTNIGIVLSVFFGAGIVLSSYIQSHSSDAAQAGINSFILGRTAGMVFADLVAIASVAAGVLLIVAFLFKELKVLCFDPDFAAVEGWPVGGLDLLLMFLLAVTTVIGLPAVGVVLMVALLILPAAAARFWVDRFGPMLLLAGLIGGATGAAGTLLSSRYSQLPAGPVIVLTGSLIFVISMLAAPRRGLVASSVRHGKLKRRRRLQGVLRTLYEQNELEFAGQRAEQIPALISELTRNRSWGEINTYRTLARARRDGLVENNAAGWWLTAAGMERAARIVRTHRMWEHYLLTSANIDRDLVDPDVELIEGILPDEEVRRLEAELRAKGRLPQNGNGAREPVLSGVPHA